MPRRLRVSPVGMAQHIIQRGNNRQVCFASDEDIAAYAYWLGEAARKFQVQIHAWVFMTNHVHLLATPLLENGVSKMMQYLGRYYVRYFNHTYCRTGTLWEGRFKSCLVQDNYYFLYCQRYIELNPVMAGMVDDPADYRWSSYAGNALGVSMNLLTPHEVYLALGSTPSECQANYRSLFTMEVDGSLIKEIRHAVNKGLILGTERFKAEVESLTGARASLRKRGPKPLKSDESG